MARALIESDADDAAKVAKILRAEITEDRLDKDSSDEAKTGKNWSLLTDEEEGPMWEPLGACDPCLPRVPAGSIPIPSEAEAAGK